MMVFGEEWGFDRGDKRVKIYGNWGCGGDFKGGVCTYFRELRLKIFDIESQWRWYLKKIRVLRDF